MGKRKKKTLPEEEVFEEMIEEKEAAVLLLRKIGTEKEQRKYKPHFVFVSDYNRTPRTASLTVLLFLSSQMAKKDQLALGT